MAEKMWQQERDEGGYSVPAAWEMRAMIAGSQFTFPFLFSLCPQPPWMGMPTS